MDRIEKLKQFLAASPGDSFLLHALALEYIKLGNDQAAHQLLENLLHDQPGYIGSYYHLGKLLERNNDSDAAIKWYEKGMEQALKAGEKHAYGELKGAWEELTF